MTATANNIACLLAQIGTKCLCGIGLINFIAFFQITSIICHIIMFGIDENK